MRRLTMLTRCGLFGALFWAFITVFFPPTFWGVHALSVSYAGMKPEEDTLTDLKGENVSTDTELLLEQKTRKRRGKRNTVGVPSFLQWGIGGLLRGSDLRGTIGNLVSTGVSMVNPGGCASQLINTGYLNDLYDEDDYPFQPDCHGTQSTENRIACFPATATVLTPVGRVTMGELKPGTLIATGPSNRRTKKTLWETPAEAKEENDTLHMSNNKSSLRSEDSIAYERVLFFLHRNSTVANQTWVTIQWQSENTSLEDNSLTEFTPGNSSSPMSSRTGKLYVSPYHLVYTCSRRSPQAKKGAFEAPFKPFRLGQQSVYKLLNTNCKPTAALRVEVGDWILVTQETLNVKSKKDTLHFAFALVTRTRLAYGSANKTMSKFDNSTDQLTGLFAPVTASGSFLVDNVYVSQYSTFADLAPEYDSLVHNGAHLLLKPFVLLAKYNPEKIGDYVSAWMDRLRESAGRTFFGSY